MSFPNFSFSTTTEEVATAFADEIRGKKWLGFEAARVIANANLVVITGYNLERLKLSEDAIKQEVPAANIRRLQLDLSSLAAVRTAAAEINAYPEPIHVLIHNAAAAIVAFKLTVDNLESQIQTDHIGPFSLTKLIAPKILASGTPGFTPRVVFVSSAAEAWGTGPNFKTLGHPDPASHVPFEAYMQAKSAKEEFIPYMQDMGIIGADLQPSKEKIENWKTIPRGAATTVAAAFDPRLNAVPGAYLDDFADATKAIGSHSADPANAEKLWNVTEEIIGEKFTF
ncbi:short-chain dehydrogenase [Mycena polygramma]|nr:short-chain dehydrogenase [Mycena polygramma]